MRGGRTRTPAEPPAGRLAAVVGQGSGEHVRLDQGLLGLVLVVDGLPVADLAPGTQLGIGEAAVVELLAADETTRKVTDGATGETAGGLTGLTCAVGGLVEATGAAAAMPARGIPARVVAPGSIRVGDTVAVEAVAVPLEDTLDLHPFRPDETAEVVREYLAQARAVGLREVRVVHGRGRGVQREIVRRLLPTLPGVTGFGDAPPERGGWGATVVRLGPDPESAPR